MKDKIVSEKLCPIVIGTAGHIDHGKSSLVRCLTGIDPDRLPEERERGLTIDLGFAPFQLDNGLQAGLIDVPGHERFIRNMVAGASGIDFAILVIAADDGIMPQTIEHLQIMTYMGISHGLIALTKVDLVEDEYADLVIEDIRTFVGSTFLEGAPVVKVSSTTGIGIDSLRTELNRMIPAMDSRVTGGVFRMPIQRVFSSKGFGTVVTGVPVSGQAFIGEKLEILPSRHIGRVRGLQAYKQGVDRIRAGHSSAINFADINHTQVTRGDVVAQVGAFVPARFIEAHFTYSSSALGTIKNLMKIKLHTGTSESLGRIVLLDKDILHPGDRGLVQLRLDDAVVTGYHDPYVLRLPSPQMTLGGGRVLGHANRRMSRFHQAVINQLTRAVDAVEDFVSRMDYVLAYSLPEFISRDEACRRAEVGRDVGNGIIDTLLEDGRLHQGEGDRLIHRESLVRAMTHVLHIVKYFHQQNPLRLGMNADILQRAWVHDEDVLTFALQVLQNDGRLISENGLFREATHQIQIDERDVLLTQRLEALYLNGAFQPPKEEDLRVNLGVGKDRFDRIHRMLEEQLVLIELKSDIFLHHTVLEEGERLIVEEIQSKGALEPGPCKELLHTTRKYLIPLLEYFDLQGVTVREGNVRKLKVSHD